MSLLTILHYPDPRLRNPAQRVESVDSSIRQLVDDMLFTMYASRGIGLAATQVNVQKQIIVVDVSPEGNLPLSFINPEITDRRGTTRTEEGCLSVPDIRENVDRAEWIQVKALNKNGEAFKMEADGILAVCIQHEVDHLDGKLFIDYLSRLKRQRILTKMKKK